MLKLRDRGKLPREKIEKTVNDIKEVVVSEISGGNDGKINQVQSIDDESVRTRPWTLKCMKTSCKCQPASGLTPGIVELVLQEVEGCRRDDIETERRIYSVK